MGTSGAAILVIGCVALAGEKGSVPTIRYVGSSTIAHFIRDAEPVYGDAQFVLDTEPESAGGEIAILEGRADLAGVAGIPQPETLEQGVEATVIGQDAIAVVVNRANPIVDLGRSQLKDIFTGKARNWKELGGPDLTVHPYIVSAASATRKVFRSAILREADYDGCEVVRPDTGMLARIEAEPGAIGQISFSFLGSTATVKALRVEGQEPVSTNPSYPITRPLYLLWWPGRARIASFISWTSTAEARALLLERFALAPEGEPKESR